MPPETASPALRRHAFEAFGGARCEVIIGEADAGDDVLALLEEVRTFEAALTRFDPRSQLSQFNAAAGSRVTVSPLLEELLRTCLEAWAMSDGLVNPAAGGAVIRAGYDRTFVEITEPVVAGGARVVQALPEVLEVGDGWAQVRRGWSIDLGGVGKGWLADRLTERYENACVNLGGDLRARGDADGAGWSVGLCDGSVVRVQDAGVATSGTTSRRWRGGHHLIDPRTGAPAVTDVAAASVVAADCLHAEVFAKAVVLLGSADGVAWLAEQGVLVSALVTSGASR